MKVIGLFIVVLGVLVISTLLGFSSPIFGAIVGAGAYLFIMRND